MKQFNLILLLTIFAFTVSAQRKVALQHNSTTTFFNGVNPFADAYTAAVDGDIIYLPGGTFAPLEIAKRITVFGAGHNPNSTTATDATMINGTLYLSAGSAGSHLEGLKIINFGSIVNGGGNNDEVVIKRCHIAGEISLVGNGIQITENIINAGVNGKASAGSANMVVSHNIIRKIYDVLADFSNNAWIHHNIIIKTGNYMYSNFILAITNSLLENNIFAKLTTGDGMDGCVGNTFRNNVISYMPPIIPYNTWENNTFDVSMDDFFVNFNGVTFDYSEDYHLKNPTAHLGTDGKQVGIYGGTVPFKDGAIPVNPHISEQHIAHETDTDGKLNVQIKAQAQER